MEEVERYVMTRLHEAALCPQTAEDKRKDQVLRARIRWAQLPGLLLVNMRQAAFIRSESNSMFNASGVQSCAMEGREYAGFHSNQSLRYTTDFTN